MSSPSHDKALNSVHGILRFPLLRNTEDIPFVEVRISQYSYRHNQVVVTVKHHVLDQNGWMSSPSSTLELLNNLMVIQLFHAQKSDDIVYHAAIITDVSFENNEGAEGDIVLSGLSPSVLLDRGEHMEAYHHQSWEQLFERIAGGIPKNLLDVKLNPVQGDEPSEFLLQYNEEGYGFLARVAAQHGEWLFHDGVSLCLGRTEQMKDPVTLIYDVDLSSMRLSARKVPSKISRYAYDALTDNEFTVEPDDPQTADISSTAWQRSQANQGSDAKATLRHSLIPATTQDGITKSVNAELSGKAASSAIVSGIALTSNVRLGQTVRIEVPQSYKNAQKALGRYVVVEAEHYLSQRGEYSCHFTAVAESGDTCYAPSLPLPQAQPLIGKVCDTEDPDGVGRVQVELQGIANWGINSGVWLRVMSPDAGNSKAVAKNRGFVFIPEKGDQVVVGFFNGDTSRPFVMGSLFHGKNAEGGGEKNFKKSITSRSGTTLTITDNEDTKLYTLHLQVNDQNSFSILVEKEEGTIKIQSSKNIYITAKELIQMEAKQILMTAEVIQAKASDKIECVAEKLLHLECAEDVEIMGKTIAEEAQSDFTQKGKTLAVKADSKMDIDGGSKLNVKGGQVKMN